MRKLEEATNGTDEPAPRAIPLPVIHWFRSLLVLVFAFQYGAVVVTALVISADSNHSAMDSWMRSLPIGRDIQRSPARNA